VVDLAVLDLRLDSIIFKVFSNLNDSMILCKEAALQHSNLSSIFT